MIVISRDNNPSATLEALTGYSHTLFERMRFYSADSGQINVFLRRSYRASGRARLSLTTTRWLGASQSQPKKKGCRSLVTYPSAAQAPERGSSKKKKDILEQLGDENLSAKPEIET